MKIEKTKNFRGFAFKPQALGDWIAWDLWKKEVEIDISPVCEGTVRLFLRGWCYKIC